MVFADLDLDGVEQVGLAQAGRTVDEQRVVRAGGVGRHGLRRRKRKLVGRPADEVLKREVVPAGGQRRLGDLAFGGFLPLRLLRRRDGQNNIDVKPQHGLERFFQQRRVTVRNDLADKIVAHQQRDAVGIFKADRLQPADVALVGSLGGMLVAILFGGFKNVVE